MNGILGDFLFMRGQVDPHERNREKFSPAGLSAGFFVVHSERPVGGRLCAHLENRIIWHNFFKVYLDIWKSGEIPAQFIPTVMKDETDRTIGKIAF